MWRVRVVEDSDSCYSSLSHFLTNRQPLMSNFTTSLQQQRLNSLPLTVLPYYPASPIPFSLPLLLFNYAGPLSLPASSITKVCLQGVSWLTNGCQEDVAPNLSTQRTLQPISRGRERERAGLRIEPSFLLSLPPSLPSLSLPPAAKLAVSLMLPGFTHILREREGRESSRTWGSSVYFNHSWLDCFSRGVSQITGTRAELWLLFIFLFLFWIFFHPALGERVS